MNSILIHKNCIMNKCKNKAVSIRGENEYCREHVRSLCLLKNEKNIYNECRCNSTVPMITVNSKKYCNSHYRTLIFKCNEHKCEKERKDNKLSFDKKWYCKKHKKMQDDKLLTQLFLVFREKIPPEITHKISKNFLTNNNFIL